VLVALGVFCADAFAQDPPPLHTEKGLKDQLTIEDHVSRQLLRDGNGGFTNTVMGRYTYHRFLIGNVLHGSQVQKHDRHILDDFQCLTTANPWDNLANIGALQAFDMRQEPLTYHHRTGPVGAVYGQLRSRKNGKDAKAPVAVMGMTAGEEACYALRGQKMTFYESDPVIVKLVADTDKYFSYISDARKRGAEIEVRIGTRRAKLKEDKDRKYALIVVDVAESFPVPTDIFTKEAVQEYFDRLTDDGMVILHISNKYLRLEPMFAKMAEELKLTARLWNDDEGGQHGKTASSWLVLARSREALGDRLCSPISDLMTEHLHNITLLTVILREYPDVAKALEKTDLKEREAVLRWLDDHDDDQRAAKYAAWIRKYQSERITLMELLRKETGYGFRPLEKLPHITAWTDAQADVFILWMSPSLQRVRKFFGYPTPIDW
jgi:hypothetical protein